MNAERLLALYDRVADAPDAIGRMRRFVLDLAVRGKLVDQDPTDEPASELLKRIAVERVRLTNAGRTRMKKAVHLQVAPPPFEVPRTWCWASLGAVFQYDAGTKCDPKTLDKSAWLLELQDIEKGTGRLLNRVRTSERESKSTKARFLPGDVLYGKLRPYLNKVIVADEVGYSTTEIVAIRPYLKLSSEYCALALRRPDFVDYVTRLGQGTKMPRLRTQDAIVAPFPLPPLAEQPRIVEKVDQLMALCDRLEETRAAREDTRDRLTKASLACLTAPDTDAAAFRGHARFAIRALPALTARADQVKHLRQTILNLAVRGKLVEQDPADEPASELLERIASARKLAPTRGRKTKSVAIPSSLAAAAFSPPTGWAHARLSQLVRVLNGRAYKKAELLDSGTPVLRVGNLFTSKHWYYSDLRLPEDKYCDEGDLLYAWSASFGPVIWQGPRAIFHYHIWKLSLFSEADLDKQFLYYFLLQQTQEIKSAGHGISMVHMTKGKMERLAVPIPPLTEQHRIVAKVDALMALCDRLEGGLDSTDGTRNRLLESLLQDTLTPSAYEAPTAGAVEA